MNYLYYDSGTTNTRLYLFRENTLLDSLNVPIGSKDSALCGSNQKLLQTLKQMMDELCCKNQIKPDQISEIWMSGMISSPTGIIEIPHLTVPIDLYTLSHNVFEYYEPIYFKRLLYIIPGIKTNCDSPSVESFPLINNMRGEETEIFGILQTYKNFAENCIMIMPGSHTQIVFIENGAITNIISTITGELYSAVKNNTILSTALSEASSVKINPEMLCKGYENLHKYGFNRALYTVRTMELFTPCTAIDRHSYFEGILNADVLNVTIRFSKGHAFNNVVVYGSNESIDIFKILFKKYYPRYFFTGISSNQKLPFSANGFLEIKSCKSLQYHIY